MTNTTEISGLVARLRAVIDGDYRDVDTADQCEHGRYGYEDCEACVIECLESIVADYAAYF